MKRFNLWLLLSLFVSACMFTACSSSDDATSGGGEQGGGDVPVPEVITKAAVSGVVSHWGSPLSGVKVSAGTVSVTTGFNGTFTLDQVSGDIVKFEKEGYATVVRKITEENQRFDIALADVQTTTFPATTAKTLDVDYTGMKVDLPASFKDESGNAYTGTVTAKSAYLTPADADFADKMPGDLTAIRTDQSEAALISYGMISVELTGDAGQKLQPGSPATLTFPVTNGVDPVATPTIPLWNFNEDTGLWEEEGIATYDATLNAYVGQVAHFSWHNLDQPELRAALKVKVLDNVGNPVVGISVNIDKQRTAYTGADGIASCVVPSNTDMVIRVESNAYGNYADVVDESGWPQTDEAKIVKQNVTLAPQETRTITMQMPNKIPVISGVVTNEGTGSKVCLLWIKYGMQETSRVISNLDGSYSMMAPANYTGDATLIAQFGDGFKVEQAITITDADQVINLTANNNAQAGAGIIQVAGPGLNTRYVMPEPSSPFWNNAVSITEGRGLSVNVQIVNQGKMDGWGHIILNIPGYTEGQTTYTSSSNSFEYMMDGPGVWTRLMSGDKEITIVVTKNGDAYTFKIVNAEGELTDRSLGLDSENAMTVKYSTEFTAKGGVFSPE